MNFELNKKHLSECILEHLVNGVGVRGGLETILLRQIKDMMPSEPSDRYVAYIKNALIPHREAVFRRGIELYRKLDHPNFGDYFDEMAHLAVHDLSKFSKEEAVYAEVDFDRFDDNPPDVMRRFSVARAHHKRKNAHHPEYWMAPQRDGSVKVLDMEPMYVWEMISDWWGVGDVYGEPMVDYLKKHLDKYVFSENTATMVAEMLRMGFGWDAHCFVLDPKKCFYHVTVYW